MKNTFKNMLFGERLELLMKGTGLDVSKKGSSTQLARKMIEDGCLAFLVNSDLKKRIDSARSRIETHRRDVDSAENVEGKWLKAYCDYFKCSADYLFGYIDFPTHENTDIQKVTGLSKTAIDYLLAKSHSKYFTNVLDILLKPGYFDNALFHIDKYMAKVCEYEKLTKTRHERQKNIISECVENYGDLISYNYPYNDTLDSDIEKVETKMDVEELHIDKDFKYLIHEIADIAKQCT